MAYLTFTMDVPLCFLDSLVATMIFMLDASFGPQLLDTSATMQYELLSYQLRYPLINLVNQRERD